MILQIRKSPNPNSRRSPADILPYFVNVTSGRAYQSRGALRLTARSAASSRLRTCSFPSTLVI